jgi:hypothetical protein
MSYDKATASGADRNDGLRRRPVPGAAAPAIYSQPEMDDTKKLAKKVRERSSLARAE